MPVRLSAEGHHLQARLARASRSGDPETIERLRAEFRAQQLADYIDQILDEAPPLTPEQCDRLIALLRPSGNGERAE